MQVAQKWYSPKWTVKAWENFALKWMSTLSWFNWNLLILASNISLVLGNTNATREGLTSAREVVMSCDVQFFWLHPRSKHYLKHECLLRSEVSSFFLPLFPTMTYSRRRTLMFTTRTSNYLKSSPLMFASRGSIVPHARFWSNRYWHTKTPPWETSVWRLWLLDAWVWMSIFVTVSGWIRAPGVHIITCSSTQQAPDGGGVWFWKSQLQHFRNLCPSRIVVSSLCLGFIWWLEVGFPNVQGSARSRTGHKYTTFKSKMYIYIYTQKFKRL